MNGLSRCCYLWWQQFVKDLSVAGQRGSCSLALQHLSFGAVLLGLPTVFQTRDCRELIHGLDIVADEQLTKLILRYGLVVIRFPLGLFETVAWHTFPCWWP